MGRFVRFLIVNVVGIGLFAWGQNSLFDWDGVRTAFGGGGYGARSAGGARTHK
ncbi:MAG: hypothetical protein AB7P21_04545 [Lautropia sp.]